MDSPTVSHPLPLRTTEKLTLDIHHPTPDLQALQGAYIANVERLEDRAERMSEHGSDLGEEIRRLQLEQKLSDSRLNSLHSAEPPQDAAKPFATRSRNASTSSYANSILDVNSAARWGGYSPGGFMTSPGGSLRSGSVSHQVPLQRQRSESRASRLGQVVTAEAEHEEAPYTNYAAPGSPQSHKSVPRHRSTSSFTRKYDQIALEIQNELEQSFNPSHSDVVPQSQYDDAHHPRQLEYPDRPPTAASTDTTHQARVLWQDFDGVHCPDTVPEEGPMPGSAKSSRESSLMKPPPPPLQLVAPPDDGMVFYPAPVPQMLNLPKRLSKAPASTVQARRRTQLLESMKADNRKSAPWLSATGGDDNRKSVMDPRKSRQSYANLPPQLRASAFFDQVAPAQEFEVKGESAEQTLDSILDASANAPVSAFTDHPFAGHVGNEVYGREKSDRRNSRANDLDKADARKSRSSLNLLDKSDQSDNRKSRSSLNLLDTRRNSNGDPLNKLKKRNSSADLNKLTVRATESRMSLGDELDDPGHGDVRGPEQGDTTPTRRSIDGHSVHSDDEAEEAEPEEEEEPQYFGPPTTLLAELQMRKAQQKSRNLNAGNAFPNGMHATLLELDAVAEIEKKKRKGHKVNLAWEAVPESGPGDDDSDDDVPLGVLFPGRDGLINKKTGPGTGPQHPSDWDRPLGLIAQREMEDNEPLSRRRNRLLGGAPGRRNQSQLNLAVPPSGTPPQPESEEEIEGETLAERLRRLKEKKALDTAIGDDVRKSTISNDFAAEMMSQFGMPDEPSKPGATPPANLNADEEPEEETLGQRRARLQAEALARGDANPLGSRPPLRGSMSMANILSAHPIDNTNQAHKITDEQLLSSLPKGSLLQKNAIQQSRKEAQRVEVNRRISSFGTLDAPLLGEGVGEKKQEPAVAGNIEKYKARLAGTPNTAPLPLFTPMGNMSAMNLAMPGSRDSYFPMQQQPLLNMPPAPGQFVYPGGMPSQQPMMPMGMMGMGMQPQMGGGGMLRMGNMGAMRPGSMMNLPLQMQQMQMAQQQQQMMGMQMGMGGMGGMGMVEAPPLDPRQREFIDSWRNGVA